MPQTFLWFLFFILMYFGHHRHYLPPVVQAPPAPVVAGCPDGFRYGTGPSGDVASFPCACPIGEIPVWHFVAPPNIWCAVAQPTGAGPRP